MEKIFDDVALDQLHLVADYLKQKIEEGENILAFYGGLGAGKTTLIKVLCQSLGVKDSMNSPTFGIVNEYRSPSEQPIFHFDFYRLENEEEAFDFGYEEYFYSGDPCLIEWPEKIENLLPEQRLDVHINEENQNRTFKIIHT